MLVALGDKGRVVTLYSVYEPPSEAQDLEDRADSLVFVKDGFSWPALFVPGLWLLYRRMWLELVLFLSLPGAWLGVRPERRGQTMFGWLGLALVVLFAFEANDLRRAALERRGYRQMGIGGRRSRDDAELAFFRVLAAAAGAGTAAGERAGAARERGHPGATGRAARRRGSSGSSRGREPMHVAIIDYGSGNLHSAAKAFERAAREQGSNLAIKVTADPNDVADAERIVLPGVGAFADCKRGLEDVPGMIEALEEAVQGRGKPFLGICVGLQLMAERGLEHGVTPGLGWIKGEVRAIAPSDPALKIPHMGWNTLGWRRAHPLARGHPDRRRRAARLFRALLSCRAGGAGDARASTDYGGPITAFVAKDNMAGTSSIPRRARSSGWR